MYIQTMLSTQRPVALVSILMLSVWTLVFLYTATDKSISDFSDNIEARFKRIRPYKVAFTKWTVRPTTLNYDDGLWFDGNALGPLEAAVSLSDKDVRRRREKMFRKFDKIHEKEINEKVKARQKKMFARFDELHITQEAKQEELRDDHQNGIKGVDLSKQTPRQLTTAAQMVLPRGEENDWMIIQKHSENKPLAVNGTNGSAEDKLAKKKKHKRKHEIKANDSRRKATGDRKEREGKKSKHNKVQKERKYQRKEENTNKQGKSKKSGLSHQNDKKKVAGGDGGVKMNQNKGKRPQRTLNVRKHNMKARKADINNKAIGGRSVINAGNVKNKDIKEGGKEASKGDNKPSEEQSKARKTDDEQSKENDQISKVEVGEEEKGLADKTTQTDTENDTKGIVDKTKQTDKRLIVEETVQNNDERNTKHIVEKTKEKDKSKDTKRIVDKAKKSIVEHIAKQSETSKSSKLKESIEDSNHGRNKSEGEIFNEMDTSEHVQSKHKRVKNWKVKKHEGGKSFYARYKKEEQSSAKRTSR